VEIALLSFEYPPETGFGGIGTYSYYHARALARLGHRVHVFAGSTRAGTFESEHDGVRVTRIKLEGWLHRALEPARARRWHWFQNRVETAYAVYTALRRAIRREHFDIVEAPECGADAAGVATMLNLPLAIRFHSPARLIMDLYEVPKMDRELTAFVEQIAISRATVRTSCSEFLAAEVQARMQVPAPIHVIPNGIDLDLFDRDEDIDVNDRFNLPADATVILFANRLEERKGIHLMAEIADRVLRKYRHVHVVLAGRDLFGYVQDRVVPPLGAAGLADRLHVLGAVPLLDVRALLKRCEIFLLPSLWENCPYSCLEAMAAGRAIVAADCGGIPELVAHRENGLLARTNFAGSFVQRLEELIESRDLRETLGAAARCTVETRLTDLEVARRTVDLYRTTHLVSSALQPER
jgi:glycosyltransferase involved in cell wall biosynthesis